MVAERESVGVGRDALYGAVIGCDHIVVELEHGGVDMVGIGSAADILGDDLVVGIAYDGIGKVFGSHRLVVDTLRRMRPRDCGRAVVSDGEREVVGVERFVVTDPSDQLRLLSASGIVGTDHKELDLSVFYRHILDCYFLAGLTGAFSLQLAVGK